MADAITNKSKLVSIRVPVQLLEDLSKLQDADSAAAIVKRVYPDFRDVTFSNLFVGLVQAALDERERKAKY